MRRPTVTAAVMAAILALGPVSTALPAGQPRAARLGHDPSTGRLIFVGAQAGHPIASATAGVKGVPPERNALSFVRDHAQALGLRDPETELRPSKTVTRADGRTVVRYQQVHQGVPVFGADVVVNTTRAGALLALSAKISPELDLSVEPKLRSDEASAEAVAVIAKYRKTASSELTASEPALFVYDARLFLPEGRSPVLAWKVEVGNGAQIREVVLVDAATAAIALHYNQVDTHWPKGNASSRPAPAARAKVVPSVLGSPLLSAYTMNNNCPFSEQNADCFGIQALPGNLVCSETSPGSCAADSDAFDAFWYAVDTYDFYAGAHGRDSINAAGMRIVQSVHYGFQYANAFWNGTQMVYGDGSRPPTT